MSPGPAKQFDQQEVLAKAMDLFWDRGYEATGMAELVKHMGIGRQSLYDTFGDKHSLFLATLRNYSTMMSGRMLGILNAPGSPVGNIRALFKFWKEMSKEGTKGCLLANASAEFGCKDDDVLQLVQDCHEKLENGFYQTLERARKEGELKDGVNTRTVARLIVVTSQGLALFSKLNKGESYLRSVINQLEDLLPVK